MSILTIIIFLALAGALLWMIYKYVPELTTRKIFFVVVLATVVLYLLSAFRIIH